MTGNFLDFIKRLVLCLLLVCSGSASLFSQADTIINKYAKVLTRNDYQITVDNATDFSAGDYALIIQMKGVSIDTDNTPNYGNLEDIVGTPGQYEFIVINSVVGNTITFLSRIKDYDPSGFVQIIRVPFFNSAGFNKKLTCKKWDAADGTGGVLALIVGGKLTLVNDIDVSGKGFSGGLASVGAGLCAGPAGISDTYSFPASFDNAGFKGEGIASHYSPIAVPELLPYPLKGQGRLLSGGGGGNGRFSGGGGGSNRGNGSDGGLQDELLCNDPNIGGNKGFGITTYPSIDPANHTAGVFMGGGGGSSTYLSGATATAGGHGGGIVFILADSIDGNNKSILASGESALTATGIYSGAGGGGAGGSIVIFSDNYSDNLLNITANGGKGGDVEQSFLSTRPEGGGVGGAGGGGYVALLKKEPLPSNISISKAGGTESFVIDIGNPDQPEGKGNQGDEGLQRTEIAPVLTGFLFNSITSDITGNQTDSICSNVPYTTITGTTPMGGEKGSGYIFVWQRSTVSGNDADFVTIPGATSKDYSPPGLLTQTTWFRRIVYDHTLPTAIEDKSIPVRIIVHQAIQHNVIVASPDTICYKSDPQLLRQGSTDIIVPSTSYLKYIWQERTIAGPWLTTPAAETLKEYNPDPAGGLTDPEVWYRRTVISGRCVDSSAVAKITVLPKLEGNDFPDNVPNDTICFGGNTDLTSVSIATGGLSSVYRYKWETSPTGLAGSWAASGSTAQYYDPDALGLLPVGIHYYRRLVFSGESDACRDTSNSTARKVWPVITNNVIKADQIIGFDSIPLRLIETSGAPAGGDGIKYTYLWVVDPSLQPALPGTNGITGNEFQPPKQIATIAFKRIVYSSACNSASNPVVITVDPIITNSISMVSPAKDIIYTGQLSSKLAGSTPSGGSGVANDYTFRWYKSATGGPLKSEWTPLTDSINLSPGYLTSDTWFRRDVSSPKILPRATTQSNIIKITVLQKITNVNITPAQSVCYGFRPLQLKGASLEGGDGIYKFTWQDSTSGHTWSNISGFVHGDSANYKPPALTSPAAYKRIVYSGKNDCGVETSNSIVIGVNPLPGVPDAGPPATVFSIQNLYHMRASPPLENETGEWDLISGSWDPDDNTAYDTEVRDLSLGKNIFSWTVTLGTCSLRDTVSVTLMDDFIPEGFSPNGDGINDTFVIEGLDPDDNYIDLSIVNGAGTEVFTTSNRSEWEDWNGKNSKGLDLPEGTYYYLLKLTPKDPLDGTETQKKKGFIVLKRY